MRTFVIGENEKGQRLDKYLKKLLPQAGSGFLYKMLRKKNITLDGKKATGNELLSAGMTVAVFFSDETLQKFMGQPDVLSAELKRLAALPMAGISVLYEDADILAANKPAGVLSQKAKADEVSANEYLLGYLLRTGAFSPETARTFRPSVCNRLDRNTSGLLLMGKSLTGAQMLSEALRQRTMEKEYRALVCGIVREGAHLSGWLVKDEAKNEVRLVSNETEHAARIETAYEPLSHGKDWTFLSVHLITGKTHQIRAHLASIGHAIVGDRKYGSEEQYQVFRRRYGIKTQLLHAYRLRLPDGRELTAPLPEAFRLLLQEET